MRRVVITGLGLVTPLACGVEATWSRLLAGQSGAKAITKFKVDDLACRIACDVPRGDGSDGSYDPNQWVDAKDQRRIDDFILYGITAAQQAVTDSGYEPKSEEERERSGVLIGSGIGGVVGLGQGARRENLRRGERLWPARRCPSHHRAGRRRQWRFARDADGVEARRSVACRCRLHQRPRHIDTHGR